MYESWTGFIFVSLLYIFLNNQRLFTFYHHSSCSGFFAILQMRYFVSCIQFYFLSQRILLSINFHHVLHINLLDYILVDQDFRKYITKHVTLYM